MELVFDLHHLIARSRSTLSPKNQVSSQHFFTVETQHYCTAIVYDDAFIPVCTTTGNMPVSQHSYRCLHVVCWFLFSRHPTLLVCQVGVILLAGCCCCCCCCCHIRIIKSVVTEQAPVILEWRNAQPALGRLEVCFTLRRAEYQRPELAAGVVITDTYHRTRVYERVISAVIYDARVL